MDELKNWTFRVMQDFLRANMEPAVIQDMAFYVMNIDSPDEARKELEQLLGVENEDYSQASLVMRSQKLSFINSYLEKRFAVVNKKKQKPIKVELSKKNIEKIQKELLGPGFTPQRICYCMARTHELVGNCMACGKIVCALEGRGACMFCGHQVVAKGENPSSLPEKASFIQAVQHKDKLIDYDRNTEERLAVIDDQNDWFDIADNTWLSEEDRKHALSMALEHQKRVEEAKGLISLSVDFRNMNAELDVGSKQFIKAAEKENEEKAQKFFMQASKNIPVNKDLSSGNKEIYEQIMMKLEKDSEKRTKDKVLGPMIVQNEDPFKDLVVEVSRPVIFEPLIFSEEDDKRQCLTMHQPWATLLVLGYKKYEGREWLTDFRGPLWIHASAKKPSDQDIQIVESQYKDLYLRLNKSPPVFPKIYHTGVLLGRVELTNVLTSDQYNLTVPEGHREENSSKFLFVIKNPMKLLVPIRMQGSKKIYSLDFDTWNGAKNGLRRVQAP